MSKKRLIVQVSPCQSGEPLGLSPSWLVSARMTDRSDLRRMAAPKSLEPSATEAAERGWMWVVIVVVKAERRVVAGWRVRGSVMVG